MATTSFGGAARHGELADLLLDHHTQYARWSQDTLANRPAAGRSGRFFYATDTGMTYYDLGTSWQQAVSLYGTAGTWTAVQTFSAGIRTNDYSLMQPSAANIVPLAIRGYASQTQNLTEWQDSAGTVQTRVAANGGLFVNNVGGFFVGPQASLAYASITAAGDAKALVLRGSASQTANVQEWQTNSGAVLGAFGSSGVFYTNGPGSFTNLNGSNPSRMYQATNAASTDYQNAALQLYLDGNADTTRSPRLSFHLAGIVASQIGMARDGSIRTFDNPGTGYATFRAGAIYSNGVLLGPGMSVLAVLSYGNETGNAGQNYWGGYLSSSYDWWHPITQVSGQYGLYGTSIVYRNDQLYAGTHGGETSMTFTAPASGNIEVELTAYPGLNSNYVGSLFGFRLTGASTINPRGRLAIGIGKSSYGIQVFNGVIGVRGLTAGGSYTIEPYVSCQATGQYVYLSAYSIVVRG